MMLKKKIWFCSKKGIFAAVIVFTGICIALAAWKSCDDDMEALQTLKDEDAAVERSAETEKAPDFFGIQDIYVVLGQEVDYLEGVSASDEEGDLTEQITVDAAAVNLNVLGEYPVYYNVTGKNGVQTQAEACVTVADAQQIQQMIGTRQIDRRNNRIIGALYEYDTGISYETTIEENLQYMSPAMVYLYYELDDGYIAAAGFLIEISDEQIYICTNQHVIGEYAEWDVYFYDGTKVRGNNVGTSERYDVGVLSVPRSEVSDEVLRELMTVHIDLNYWESLGNEQIDVGLLRVDKNGDVLHIICGKVLKRETDFPWGNGEKETELEIEQVQGDSGSAIFDQYGNLISMVYGTSHDIGGDRNWGIPLDAIISSYEEITGRTPYIYE